MSSMFIYCSLLISLPDISNWNTKNVKDISRMFINCISLINLPDIINWDKSNVTELENIYY